MSRSFTVIHHQGAVVDVFLLRKVKAAGRIKIRSIGIGYESKQNQRVRLVDIALTRRIIESEPLVCFNSTAVLERQVYIVYNGELFI